MGVYIKGMKMPKHCFKCSTKVDPDNRRCNIDGHVFEETLEKLTCRRDDSCPLVPVPSHGRLIDADEIIQERHQHYEYLTDTFYVTVRDIELAPTIIEANKEE